MRDPSNGFGHHHGAEQAPKRHRNRGPAADRRLVRRAIERAARDRHEAWLATGQPERTERLTRELDELYGEKRVDRTERRA